jgi:nucleoside 2-deoxyribosyltransferase
MKTAPIDPENLRQRLHKRYLSLSSSDYQIFHSKLRQYWKFLNEQPLFLEAFKEIERRYESLKSEVETAFATRQITRLDSGPIYSDDDEELVAISLFVIDKCVESDDGMIEVNIGRAYNRESRHDDALRGFMSLYAQPVYEYLDELLLDHATFPAKPASSIGFDHSVVEPNYVFILMSMNETDRLLEDVHAAIKQTCAQFDLRAERADDIEHSGRITDKIIERIRAAKILVADLSHERPNVYYELGFAHGLNREVILVAQKDTQLHFDIKDFNVIFYTNTSQLKSRLKKRLNAILKG